ncbi:MAG: pyrimidine 5'-nucleotidase [Hyphomicrobiaceae bacterium]|nr:pyrimidine 5'-nucleotidase [Hyphomicrobiaceae bacterium]
MRAASLSHVTDWIFDLDNTLYPRECNLFAQIDLLITQYMIDVTGLEHDAARKLQKDYYRDHGTTLNGLMVHYGIDPNHYLDTVHRIDYSSVEPDPELVGLIAGLPGRKFIFTNADAGHARKVLERLGGDPEMFDGLFDIRDSSFSPKPIRSAYDAFVDHFAIDPSRAAMFDDLDKNLVVPHQMGMSTIQVVAHPDWRHDQVDAWELDRDHKAPHIHELTEDLKQFLASL